MHIFAYLMVYIHVQKVLEHGRQRECSERGRDEKRAQKTQEGWCMKDYVAIEQMIEHVCLRASVRACLDPRMDVLQIPAF